MTHIKDDTMGHWWMAMAEKGFAFACLDWKYGAEVAMFSAAMMGAMKAHSFCSSRHRSKSVGGDRSAGLSDAVSGTTRSAAGSNVEDEEVSKLRGGRNVRAWVCRHLEGVLLSMTWAFGGPLLFLALVKSFLVVYGMLSQCGFEEEVKESMSLSSSGVAGRRDGVDNFLPVLRVWMVLPMASLAWVIVASVFPVVFRVMSWPMVHFPLLALTEMLRAAAVCDSVSLATVVTFNALRTFELPSSTPENLGDPPAVLAADGLTSSVVGTVVPLVLAAAGVLGGCVTGAAVVLLSNFVSSLDRSCRRQQEGGDTGTRTGSDRDRHRASVRIQQRFGTGPGGGDRGRYKGRDRKEWSWTVQSALYGALWYMFCSAPGWSWDEERRVFPTGTEVLREYFLGDIPLEESARNARFQVGVIFAAVGFLRVLGGGPNFNPMRPLHRMIVGIVSFCLSLIPSPGLKGLSVLATSSDSEKNIPEQTIPGEKCEREILQGGRPPRHRFHDSREVRNALQLGQGGDSSEQLVKSMEGLGPQGPGTALKQGLGLSGTELCQAREGHLGGWKDLSPPGTLESWQTCSFFSNTPAGTSPVSKHSSRLSAGAGPRSGTRLRQASVLPLCDEDDKTLSSLPRSTGVRAVQVPSCSGESSMVGGSVPPLGPAVLDNSCTRTSTTPLPPKLLTPPFHHQSSWILPSPSPSCAMASKRRKDHTPSSHEQSNQSLEGGGRNHQANSQLTEGEGGKGPGDRSAARDCLEEQVVGVVGTGQEDGGWEPNDPAVGSGISPTGGTYSPVEDRGRTWSGTTCSARFPGTKLGGTTGGPSQIWNRNRSLGPLGSRRRDKGRVTQDQGEDVYGGERFLETSVSDEKFLDLERRRVQARGRVELWTRLETFALPVGVLAFGVRQVIEPKSRLFWIKKVQGVLENPLLSLLMTLRFPGGWEMGMAVFVLMVAAKLRALSDTQESQGGSRDGSGVVKHLPGVCEGAIRVCLRAFGGQALCAAVLGLPGLSLPLSGEVVLPTVVLAWMLTSGSWWKSGGSVTSNTLTKAATNQRPTGQNEQQSLLLERDGDVGCDHDHSPSLMGRRNVQGEVEQSVWSLSYILSGRVGHRVLVVLAEAFRARLLCDALDAARSVVDSGPGLGAAFVGQMHDWGGDGEWHPWSTRYMLIGVLAGCGGLLFFPLKMYYEVNGGSPTSQWGGLASGRVSWAIQSSLYGAVFYSLAGGAVPGAAALVSLSFCSVALVQTCRGPRFNPFGPLHSVLYRILGLGKSYPSVVKGLTRVDSGFNNRSVPAVQQMHTSGVSSNAPPAGKVLVHTEGSSNRSGLKSLFSLSHQHPVVESPKPEVSGDRGLGQGGGQEEGKIGREVIGEGVRAGEALRGERAADREFVASDGEEYALPRNGKILVLLMWGVAALLLVCSRLLYSTEAQFDQHDYPASTSTSQNAILREDMLRLRASSSVDIDDHDNHSGDRVPFIPVSKPTAEEEEEDQGHEEVFSWSGGEENGVYACMTYPMSIVDEWGKCGFHETLEVLSVEDEGQVEFFVVDEEDTNLGATGLSQVAKEIVVPSEGAHVGGEESTVQVDAFHEQNHLPFGGARVIEETGKDVLEVETKDKTVTEAAAAEVTGNDERGVTTKDKAHDINGQGEFQEVVKVELTKAEAKKAAKEAKKAAARAEKEAKEMKRVEEAEGIRKVKEEKKNALKKKREDSGAIQRRRSSRDSGEGGGANGEGRGDGSSQGGSGVEREGAVQDRSGAMEGGEGVADLTPEQEGRRGGGRGGRWRPWRGRARKEKDVAVALGGEKNKKKKEEDAEKENVVGKVVAVVATVGYYIAWGLVTVALG